MSEPKFTPLPNGLMQVSLNLTAEEINPKVRKLVEFLQNLCDSNPALALAVLECSLDALKRMFDVRGDVVMFPVASAHEQ